LRKCFTIIPGAMTTQTTTAPRPACLWIYGDTSSGERIVVVFEDWSDDDLIIIRPKTAYPVKEYGS
jgi:hypothetical protein